MDGSGGRAACSQLSHEPWCSKITGSIMVPQALAPVGAPWRDCIFPVLAPTSCSVGAVESCLRSAHESCGGRSSTAADVTTLSVAPSTGWAYLVDGVVIFKA